MYYVCRRFPRCIILCRNFPSDVHYYCIVIVLAKCSATCARWCLLWFVLQPRNMLPYACVSVTASLRAARSRAYWEGGEVYVDRLSRYVTRWQKWVWSIVETLCAVRCVCPLRIKKRYKRRDTSMLSPEYISHRHLCTNNTNWHSSHKHELTARI
jgi:hypothetical protein